MKRTFIYICITGLLVLAAVPAFADGITKDSFSHGDFIGIQEGDKEVVCYVENNRNPSITELRRWAWECHTRQIAWYRLEKVILGVYRYGTPEWCEKAKEYLK